MSAALADRLARLPSETADVLLETAALARPTVELVVAAHGDRETVLSSFAAAAADGLIVLDDERVRFTHPLHASVCYQQAPIWKRRAVHRRLALVVADPEERALHLAWGAEGPNAEIAAQLDATAEGAAARGAPAVGANLLELAADMTPDDLRLVRDRRRRAAVLHRVSGSTARAIAILEALRDAAEPGAERADVLAELAASNFRNPSVIVSLCNDALIEAAGDDRRSARLLADRSVGHWVLGEVPAALADGWAALELAERLEDPALIAVAIAHISHAQARSVETTRLLLDRGVQIERAEHLALEFLDSPRRALARQHMRMGEVEEARSLLEELASEAAARGDENTRVVLLWVLVLVDIVSAYGYTKLTGAGAMLVIGAMLMRDGARCACLLQTARRGCSTTRDWRPVRSATAPPSAARSEQASSCLSILMAAGLEGAAVVATDAVDLDRDRDRAADRCSAFAGVVTAQVLAFALLIGLRRLARRIPRACAGRRLPIHVHTAILDAVVLIGGGSLDDRGAGALTIGTSGAQPTPHDRSSACQVRPNSRAQRFTIATSLP